MVVVVVMRMVTLMRAWLEASDGWEPQLHADYGSTLVTGRLNGHGTCMAERQGSNNTVVRSGTLGFACSGCAGVQVIAAHRDTYRPTSR
eukprot:14284121-Alexandrium_andersonii.AAC.1